MLKFYCQEKSIKIGYVVSYIYNKNGTTKKYLRILVILKNTLLIDISFQVNIWVKAMDTSNYLYNRLLIKYSKRTVILIKT